MMLFKILMKIVLVPVWILTVLAQGIGAFFSGIAGIVLGLLSVLLWILAITGVVFGGCTGQEAMQMIAMSLGAFLITQLCHWMLEIIVAFRCFLGEKIRS